MTVQSPLWLQGKGYAARNDRRLQSASFGVGITDPGALKASFSSNMVVSVAAGTAYILGSYISNQGNYLFYNDSAVTVTHSVGGANPRIDQIIARVYDKTDSGDTSDDGRIEIVRGAESSSATLASRDGAASLPYNCILLADVLVGAGVTALAANKIQDRRPIAAPFYTNSIQGDTSVQANDFVLPQPIFGCYTGQSAGMGNDYTLAAPFFISRAINVTQIIWTYNKTASGAGNSKWAICDASGRVLSTTGAYAWITGSGLETVTQSITSFLSAGMYFFLYANDYTSGTAPTCDAHVMTTGNPTGLMGTNVYAKTSYESAPANRIIDMSMTQLKPPTSALSGGAGMPVFAVR